ncbi:enoyl-CoA hydratase/isomerase family protein [Microbacterium soli]|uniref:Enoyl-CoA hydratase/isomerase family protein n=1 Tax=Microbacterium soli TaxID=446075 RepID=A0ABP7N6L9_9MICO
MTEVELSYEGDSARLTLNRPARLNAFDLALAAQLLSAVEEVSASECSSLVIQSTGRAFCAGGDVRAMSDSGSPDEYLRRLTDDVHAAITVIRALPMTVIARVQGPVAGGGLGLMLAADVSIASDLATFTAGYGALGLSPDCGVSLQLPAAIGAQRARSFLLGMTPVDAQTAGDWGLVSRVVAHDALDTAVEEAVARARLIGAAAAGATKRLLDHTRWADGLEREAELISHLAATTARHRIDRYGARRVRSGR